MRRVRALAVAVSVAISAFFSARAWALCPNCLGQSSTLGPALRWIALFLLVPPAIFFTVARVIQRIARAPDR